MDYNNQQPQAGYPQFPQTHYQPQPGQYYVQGQNPGAQQVYYTQAPIQVQPQVQYMPPQVQYTPTPQIQTPKSFGNPNCARCFGTGFDAKKKKPCKICTAASGVCYKCGGTGQTRKGRPCKNCAYHSNSGGCPACTLKKALSGKNNNPCLICKTIQKVTY